MTSQMLTRILPIYLLLLLTIATAAQPAEKSPGIQLFEKGDFGGAIVLLKTSYDLVDLYYLGAAYEKSGNEKEARKAFDRSFRNGYKEFGEEIIKRSMFDPKQIVPDDKLSIYLEKHVGRIAVTAASALKTLELKGPSSNQSEWIMRSRMIGEIGRLLASDQLVYSARELDIDAKINNKPRPGYTDEARRNGTQGTVELLVLLGSDGKVMGVLPTKLLSNGLTERAYQAATRISFTPAEKADKPVAILKAISYSFSIY